MRRTSIVVVSLLLTACKTAPAARPDLEPPTLPAQDMVVLSQSLTDCSVKLTGTVEAAAEPVLVEKARIEFVVDGVVLKTSEQALDLAVPAGTKADFALEQSFTYVKDAAELSALSARGGSLLLALRGTLVVKVQRPALGDQPAEAVSVELPFARAKEVRTPRHPLLKVQDFDAGRFSESEVQAVFHVAVVNPNNFPLTMNGLRYAVSLGGKQVGEGTLGAGDKVAPASTGLFDITATINEETHGQDVKRLIKSLVLPYALTAKLTAPLLEETLDAKGEIKLNQSK